MYKVAQTLRRTHGQEGAVALNIESGQVYRLNPVGSRIVELLGLGVSEHDIPSVISAEFEEPINIVRSDMNSFLDELSQVGVIERDQSI